MKKLIFLACLGAIVYFGFVQSYFKRDFHFNGEVYSHVKKVSLGNVVNHFYTPNGDDVNDAVSAIQILELNENIQKNQWGSELKPIIDGYGLKSFKGDGSDFAGNFERGGLFFKSYAVPIHIDGQDHMIIYLFIPENNEETDSSKRKIDTIKQLKLVESSFT